MEPYNRDAAEQQPSLIGLFGGCTSCFAFDPDTTVSMRGTAPPCRERELPAKREHPVTCTCACACPDRLLPRRRGAVQHGARTAGSGDRLSGAASRPRGRRRDGKVGVRLGLPALLRWPCIRLSPPLAESRCIALWLPEPPQTLLKTRTSSCVTRRWTW